MSLAGTNSLGAALKNSSFRLLAAFLITYALLVTYGRTHFYRDPGSIFYDPDRAYTRQYSDFRQAEAETFIEKQIKVNEERENGLNHIETVKASKEPTICASFATLKRNGAQYIDYSIASALQGLTPAEREDLYVSVFFANSDPEDHPSYRLPWLENTVDEIYSQPLDDSERISQVQDLERAGNFSAKGVLDYTYGLKHCYDKGTPYILMFEGDVLVADGWLVKTMQALEDAQQKLQKSAQQWLYLRLFNQERSTGWGSKRIGGNNEHWITVGIVAAILCVAALFRRRGPSSSAYVDTWTLLLICILVVPSFVVLFFQAGKASVLPPQPGVFEQGFGCCSQALLFPREQVSLLIDYLTEKDHGQVDLMINRHARDQELSRLSLYPVQVQHVGIESVRGTNKDEAQAIWSMAFEDKDPVTLRKEHDDLVNIIYSSGEG